MFINHMISPQVHQTIFGIRVRSPKAHDCGRAAGHLMHGCFEREDLLFADKMLEKGRVGAVDARVFGELHIVARLHGELAAALRS